MQSYTATFVVTLPVLVPGPSRFLPLRFSLGRRPPPLLPRDSRALLFTFVTGCSRHAVLYCTVRCTSLYSPCFGLYAYALLLPLLAHMRAAGGEQVETEGDGSVPSPIHLACVAQ